MSDYLANAGWKRVGNRNNGSGNTQYWTHPDHQPVRHGFFTKTSATLHQRRLDAGWTCSCLPERANGAVRVIKEAA